MSLFKSREWWNTSCGVDENFNNFHLCIGKLEEKREIVIVASLEGYLRVYEPHQQTSDNSNDSDLLLETMLPDPILGIESGRFNNTDGLHLAILHPRKLAILKVTIKEGDEIHTYCLLDLMYERDLPCHAYSLHAGRYGLCVQSLTEGVLYFFENEGDSISCRLPCASANVHPLPVCICNIPSTDSLVVGSFSIYSYSYQSLASSAIEQTAARDNNLSGNKVLSEWEFEVGELITDVKATDHFIVAIGERYLYCLKDTGIVLWTKKLDYHPVALTLITSVDGSLVILVCTEAKTLMVYKENAVAWNCKLSFVPLAMKIANFESVKGLIVLLSETGQLSVEYLGTQHQQFDFCPPTQRVFNYELGLKEIQKLNEVVKIGKPKVDAGESKNIIDLQLDSEITQEAINTDSQVVNTVKGNVHILLSKFKLSELRLSFRCDSLIIITPMEVKINLNGIGEAWIPILVEVKANGKRFISSLEIEIITASVSGEEWSASKSFFLPLRSAMNLSIPLREAPVKITITSNNPVLSNLTDLFKDFNETNDSMANVIAMEHQDGTVVSILASKSTNKYRIQSTSLSALALPIAEFERRLQLHFKGVNLELESTLPVQELWIEVENHFAAHSNLQNAMNKLGKVSRQFQVVQRVFHNKMATSKSKESSATFSIVQLACDQVMQVIQENEHFQEEFNEAEYSLEASLRCMLSVLSLDNGAQQRVNLLAKALFPVVQSDIHQLWEKNVEIKLNFVIRTLNHPPTTESNNLNNQDFNLINFKKIFFHSFDLVSKIKLSTSNQA